MDPPRFMGETRVRRRKKTVSVEVSPDSDACANCPPLSKAGVPFPQRAPNTLAQGSKTDVREPCSWFEVHHLVRSVASQIKDAQKKYDCILSVSTGGLIPAKLLAEELGIDNIVIVPFRNKKLVASEMPVLRKTMR